MAKKNPSKKNVVKKTKKGLPQDVRGKRAKSLSKVRKAGGKRKAAPKKKAKKSISVIKARRPFKKSGGKKQRIIRLYVRRGKPHTKTTLTIRFGSADDIKEKIYAILHRPFPELDYFLRKKPRLFTLVLEVVRKSGGKYYNADQLSTTVVINKKNIRGMIAQSLADYNDSILADYADKYDEPLEEFKIVALHLKFAYAKKDA